ncbi:hypothetical protein JCM19992_21360 [Thermostilla marina]
MRVRAKFPDQLVIPPEIEPYCRQRFITGGKEYEVHAIYCVDGLIFLQYVDDLGYPSFHPSILFDVVDTSILSDWVCNVFAPEPDFGAVLALGPEFVVKTKGALQAMIEHEADQVDLFWKRIESIEKAREEQRWLDELEKEEGQTK